MKDMGAAKNILGMEIKGDRVQKKLYLCQKEYIIFLSCFRMTSTKPVCTPLTSFICLSKLNTTQSESEKEYMSHVPYASFLGSLMYAMVCIRPDLAQAIIVVNRYMGNLGKEHWQVVKHIFRYLKGTTDIGLVYHGDTSCALSGYSDSNYATNLDARISMIGYNSRLTTLL